MKLYLDKAKQILTSTDRKWTYISFGLGFIIIYLILLISNVQEFYGDTSYYWEQSSRLFWVDGHFAINFDPALARRGYLIGLLFFILRFFTLLPIQFFWISWSLFISAFFTLLLPHLFTTILKKKWTFASRLIPLLLTLFFWPFVYLYPASELLAFFFMSLSLLSIYKIVGSNSMLQKLLFSALLGGSLYATYDIRPVFLYNILLALTAIIWIYRKKILQLIPILGISLIAFAIVAAPQLIINRHVYHQISITNPISLATPKWGNNEWIMCASGSIQEYITNTTPVEGIESLDPIAEKLWKHDGSCEGFTYRTWFSALAHHPLQMIGIYGAKFANFLDMRYGDVYVSKLTTGDRTLRTLLSFAFWFISFAGMFIAISGSKSAKNPSRSVKSNSTQLERIKHLFSKNTNYIGQSSLFFIFAIFPAFLASTEVRYFIPLFLLCAVFLSNYFPWKRLKERICLNPVNYALMGGGILMLFLAIYNFSYALNPDLLEMFVR